MLHKAPLGVVLETRTASYLISELDDADWPMSMVFIDIPKSTKQRLNLSLEETIYRLSELGGDRKLEDFASLKGEQDGITVTVR